MKKKSAALIMLVLVCAAAGFLIPFWPLMLLAVALAVVYGPLYIALALGLLFDLLLGSSTGLLSFIYFPFFLFALGAFGVKVFATRYLIERQDFDTI